MSGHAATDCVALININHAEFTLIDVKNERSFFGTAYNWKKEKEGKERRMERGRETKRQSNKEKENNWERGEIDRRRDGDRKRGKWLKEYRKNKLEKETDRDT